jgi:hypothetical protein
VTRSNRIETTKMGMNRRNSRASKHPRGKKNIAIPSPLPRCLRQMLSRASPSLKGVDAVEEAMVVSLL